MRRPPQARAILAFRSANRQRTIWISVKPVAAWNPRQIATQNVDGESGSHEDSAYPEAPVTMHSSPVRTGIRFAVFTTISLTVMLASGHLFSIS